MVFCGNVSFHFSWINIRNGLGGHMYMFIRRSQTGFKSLYYLALSYLCFVVVSPSLSLLVFSFCLTGFFCLFVFKTRSFNLNWTTIYQVFVLCILLLLFNLRTQVDKDFSLVFSSRSFVALLFISVYTPFELILLYGVRF